MDLTYEIKQMGLESKIQRLSGTTEVKTRNRVVEFSTGKERGQLRRDCEWQVQDMIGIQLGLEGRPLTDEDRERMKAIEVVEVHIGERHLDKTYTVLDGSYSAFLKDALHSHLGDPCWFLPSKNLGRASVYEGQLAAILVLIEESWDEIYEFTLSARDLGWMADYDHHHAVLIYGDEEATRVKFLVERRKWADKILSCSWYPKTERE